MKNGKSNGRLDNGSQSEKFWVNDSLSDNSFDQQNDAEIENQAVDEALEGEARAGNLRHMKKLLIERRARLLNDLVTVDEADKAKLRRDIQKLEEQIQVLAEEAEITQFVEDAVRVGIEMRKLQN